MKLHEHQGKDLLKKYGIPVGRSAVVFSVNEAHDAAKQFGGNVVVKAQIHAGGRGKGGGVKLAKSADEARAFALQILGMQLITHQTGPTGQKVSRLLIEEACPIARELYLGLTLDRSKASLVLMTSTEGGMDIEEVAHKSPEKILKLAIDPVAGIDSAKLQTMARQLKLEGTLAQDFVSFATNIARAYTELDASLLEINPLVVTQEKKLLALDAKIVLDDNALFRHPEFESLRDLSEEDPAEIDAKKFGLSYISLDGNIGCMVNGAGLAMATMDIIKLAGGEPANFLDVGGSATKENVSAAFKIILRDPKVKGILVNIFGGIMKCDVIAEGIIAATKELHVKVPVVVRLQGTNADKGRALLAASGLKLIPAEGLADAAEKAVAALM
ncbi:MAG: succinate--CoA ligase subunit beta [Deltaproteobacteria bacterium RIFCSPLOWO2_02_FULL_44_10]|nr:MAG: succinate--CoA ligase subunit beta [Deltaproteobacteria bacterium RIFCSPHIGHO2_02_FULL_44_16]OGQ45654.1 MAG: succinate--CoA ligase subunit beta [Deltaproteobacteria bacterium RIFCSPLOWO2_02_FULL_44_10]